MYFINDLKNYLILNKLRRFLMLYYKYRKIINYLTWIIPNGNLRREIRNIFKKLLETADKIDCFVDNVNRIDYIENKDNFVILKVAGGFTDQILTYIVGKYIQIKYNRKVKYDLGWYEFHGMDDYNLNKRNFDLLNVFPNLDFNVATKEEASLYRNLFYFRTSIGEEFHNLLTTRKKLYLAVRPNELECYYSFKNDFNKIFDFDNNLSIKLSGGNKKAYDKIISSACPVAIHIRAGDLLKDLKKLDKKYLLKSIEIINKKLYPQKPTFFIFSNDMNYVKKNIINSKFKFYDIEFVEENDNDKGFIDWYLMFKCRHIISTVGRFAITVYAFIDYNDKILITPHNINSFNN